VPEVVDNPSLSRLEIVEDAGVAVLEYRIVGDQLVIVHTGVPKQFEGMGYGSRLVRAGIAMARDRGLHILPLCPYARSWIEGHPDQLEGVTIDPVD